ncbi:MAG: hypothetical protein M1828_005551 [Chrysothrix sp. TS-e1954]|nr:MAG: hypothetical protein M1828_005551 [Chrysothrix sp. TS-e1954]
MQRKDEILAKKAKLAELKRQRELKAQELTATKQRAGTPSDAASTPPRRETRQDLDTLISSLVGDDKGGSPAPGTPSPLRSRGARQSTAGGRASLDAPLAADGGSPARTPAPAGQPNGGPQTLTLTTPKTTYEIASEPPKRHVETYSKGVQTGSGDIHPRTRTSSDSEASRSRSPSGRERPPARRLSRRRRHEELRSKLRLEIEEELKATQDALSQAGTTKDSKPPSGSAAASNFPARALNAEENEAVTSSNDFLDFVERSSKVIERALDDEYDVLADYRHGDIGRGEDEDDEIGGRGKKGRRIKEIMQFYDEKGSRRRMISDVGFSPKFPELLLSSHTKNPSSPASPTGLLHLWNLHLHSRPELTLHSTSDILTAQFSPFHANLLLAGTYSGQVLLWDTRNRSPDPALKSPLTGQGHTHPIYGVKVVGTQNAHSVVSVSTDGVVCSWAMDMLGLPQEYLELSAPASLPPLRPPAPTPLSTATTLSFPTPLSSRPTDDLAPTCLTFPNADPTYFLAGSESGTIHLVHRYDRAGARAGVDSRVSYRGHAGPVMSLDFHGSDGPLDLGDLMLSTGVDWSVKLWRIKTPSSTSVSSSKSNGASAAAAAAVGDEAKVDIVAPILDLGRDDAVYDAKWSPVKPGVFASVDGAGGLDIWDLAREAEVPIARGVPGQRRATSSSGGGAIMGLDGSAMGGNTGGALNKCAWEPHEGRRVACGGIDGVLSVWELGGELGGAESAGQDEWGRVRRLVQRLDGRR